MAESWGTIGHRITAAIAERYLTKNAADNINKIMSAYPDATGKPFTSLITLSTYADEFRPQNTWSSAFHYINMPPPTIQYDEASQCPGPAFCITKALQNYTAVLRDRAITAPLTKGQALAFVVHFMVRNILKS